MADPIWLPDVLRAAGLDVREYPGWRDRGHGDFGNIWGVVAHHTGSFGATPGSIANHPELGLCSQLYLGSDGVYTVVGAGVAYHAGSGSYPGLPANAANQYTIGIEAANDGGGTPGRPHRSSWSDAQYDAYVRGVAAILRHLGHDASRVIAHKEWAGAAQGKWDPGAMDMNIFRADVAKLINNKLAGGADVALEETFVNYRGNTVTLGTAVRFIDQHVNEIREQLGGPKPFNGWPQLGGKTMVDAIADTNRKLDDLATAVNALLAASSGKHVA